MVEPSCLCLLRLRSSSIDRLAALCTSSSSLPCPLVCSPRLSHHRSQLTSPFLPLRTACRMYLPMPRLHKGHLPQLHSSLSLSLSLALLALASSPNAPPDGEPCLILPLYEAEETCIQVMIQRKQKREWEQLGRMERSAMGEVRQMRQLSSASPAAAASSSSWACSTVCDGTLMCELCCGTAGSRGGRCVREGPA